MHAHEKLIYYHNDMIIKGGNIFMLQGNRNAEQITEKNEIIKKHKNNNNINVMLFHRSLC